MSYFVKKVNGPNPWFSIWLWPGKTIQYLMETQDNNLTAMLLLFLFDGFIFALGLAAMVGVGDKLNLLSILLLSLILGGLYALFNYTLGMRFLQWTGRFFGGETDIHTLRVAFAWSFIPVVWASVMWLPEFGMYGADLFRHIEAPSNMKESLYLLNLGCGLMEMILGLWIILIHIFAIAKAQKFSLWRAGLNWVVYYIFLFAVSLGAGLPILAMNMS